MADPLEPRAAVLRFRSPVFDRLEVIGTDMTRVVHLDLPTAASRDARYSIDLDVCGLIHYHAMPVLTLRPDVGLWGPS
jgi:hypothetical protein